MKLKSKLIITSNKTKLAIKSVDAAWYASNLLELMNRTDRQPSTFSVKSGVTNYLDV